MIARAVAWSGRHPLRVLLAALGIAGASYFGQRSLARDVLPDLSDPQIVLFAEWMGHPALEVSTQVTQVLTDALQGVPGSTAIRGQSMGGMAFLDVIFGSVSDIHEGRAEILARVEKLRPRLPSNLRLQVGPEASSTGWVFQYALVPPQPKKGGMPMGARRPDEGPSSLYGLRKFQDEILKPEIAAIPGVAEVASVGGDPKEVLVETSPEQLSGAGVALSDIVAAAHSVLKNPQVTPEQLQNAPIGPSRNDGQGAKGARLSRVADVRVAPGMSSGMADIDGLQPIVAGIVIAKRDADIASLLVKVRGVIDNYRKRLPKDARLGVIYDRSELGSRVEQTLFRAVGEEIVVVSLVLLVFLLHLRSALMPMLTLPLVVLLTFVSMRIIGLPATIMSLGGIAIALGMAVDADLVALEACHRRIESGGGKISGADKRPAIIAAAGSFAPAILTSLVIAALAFIPVFAFGGESGRLLRPLAITKTLVIAAAALLALTVAPALRDRLLGRRVVAELKNPLTRNLVRAYRPFVHFALSRPVFTLATAGLAAVSCLPIVATLGGEFLPRLDEGSLLYMPTTASGVSSDDAVADLGRQDRAIADRPEVALVFGKAGRADSATDPAPYSMIETTVRLRPRSQWPKLARQRWYSGWAPAPLRRVLGHIWPEKTPATTAELVESLDHSTRFAGWINAWTAPIRARLDMMSTGVRTPAGIRIVTDDHRRLDALGAAVRSAVLAVPGTKSAFYESLGGETRLAFVPDAAAMARHHVDPALAHATAELLIGGGWLGEMKQPNEVEPEPEGTAVAARRDGANGVIEPAVLILDPKAEKPRPQAETQSAPVDPAWPLRVRLTLADRWHPRPLDQWLREATVRGGTGAGQPVPLALLGRAEYVTVPSQLRAERGGPVGYVYVNLTENTDVAKYVDRARDQVDKAVKTGPTGLRAGERLEWTGQYELMVAGEKRLMLIAPLVALLMLGLLLIQFRSLTEALIVLASVPFALVGSFWTLYFLDYKMSAPVWVGLLSVVGLAMQTGVVMVVYIDDAFHRRMRNGEIRNRADVVAAHAEGTVLRLRPKIMTITSMGAGLLPLLWAQGSGAEIMRRVAAPMLGGLLTSAFLTLEVIPVLYTIWRYHQLRRAQRLGVPLEQVVRAAPAWARHDEKDHAERARGSAST